MFLDIKMDAGQVGFPVCLGRLVHRDDYNDAPDSGTSNDHHKDVAYFFVSVDPKEYIKVPESMDVESSRFF